MIQKEKYLKKFDYTLPENLIAQKPVYPRDSARLLIYSRKTSKIHYDKFSNITKYLPKNSALVFNQTKVIPARLLIQKEKGGRAKILYIGKQKDHLVFLSDRKLSIGSTLFLNEKIKFKVLNHVGHHYHLKPSFKISSVYKILEKYGQTPIPPYIKKSSLKESELKKKYQTVFAKRRGSVAAPTASLHFTKKLIKKIKASGRTIAFITLHVNLGTFASITEENLRTNRLHREFFEIDSKTASVLNKAKKEKKIIIPVGTTSLRALESASNQDHQLKYLTGNTDLFIKDKYSFRFADGLITNFHVPKSSLLMLVSSLVGQKEILEIYKKAIAKKFRFFSFGDGMLIL